AAGNPRPDKNRDAFTFDGSADIQDRLVPVRIDNYLTAVVTQQQICLPVVFLAGLNLKPIDVTDVVRSGLRRVRAIARNDSYPLRQIVSAPQLIVEPCIFGWHQ